MTMSRPRFQRSYSTSHAHAPSYSVTHTVPSLGQGATIVRTPSDATSCMAQATQQAVTQGNHWPHRQHSLREPPRRPSATPSPVLPAEDAFRVASPPPVLPNIESSSLELLSDINDVHSRHSKVSSSYATPTYIPCAPSPTPSNSGSYVDIDAEYQRRLASRTSNATITPNRHTGHSQASSASPGTRPSVLPNTPHTLHHQASNGSFGQRDHPNNGGHHVYPHNQSTSSVRSSPRAAAHRPLVSAGVQPALPASAMATTSPPRPSLTRSVTMPTKHVASSSVATARMPSKHAPSLSVVTIAPPSTAAIQPFAPILVSHNNRIAPGPSMVLVTMRFSYSLDADPNTHEVTVTLDTLRPAGGRLIAFLDATLRPHSFQSSSSNASHEGGCTPPLSLEGTEMTDGSSTEDSDFEYDDNRLHPMLRDEYLVALALASSPGASPKNEFHSHSPASSVSPSRTISRQPSRRGLGPPPTAYPASLGFGTGTPLPPLSALPAALAQARADRDAAATAANSASHCGTPPLSIRRPRSNTCPGPAKGTITELTVLLQRDAGAWHTIASRLCSGSWPELAGRRRRVEDECRWAGMDALLVELQQMPTLSRRGGFV